MFTKIYINRFFSPRFKLICLTIITSLTTHLTLKAQFAKSSFNAKLINIEAAANEVFRYSTSLHNGSTKDQVYELKAQLPVGWAVTYRVDGNQITAISMEANKTQDIAIEISSTPTASPNKYKIPIRAISATDTLLLQLEAVVKGSYGISLSTPNGRLSEELTSGNNKQLRLILKNTGTLPLNDVNLSSQLPNNWQVTFEPAQIKNLGPGNTVNVTAVLSVPDKTIAGDYAATLTASNNNTTTQAAFRFIVKTSLLAGWIGLLVILAAIASVYYLIKKYGRR